MKKNRSYNYLLPLIEGWSADADYPLQTYAKGGYGESLILVYNRDATRHPGEVIFSDDEIVVIICPIDPIYLKDYKLIMDGDYSKIRDKTKSKIVCRNQSKSEARFLESIFYKNKGLKNKIEESLGIRDIEDFIDEYDSKMFHEEIFDLDIYGGESITV